jgi:hypothetical protein
MMGSIDELYDEALAHLASGRTDRASAALRIAGARLTAIASAAGQRRTCAAAGSLDGQRKRGIEGEASMRCAGQRLRSLREALAREIRRTAEAREHLRDRRRLQAAFGGAVAARGNWVDRSG